MRDVGGIPATCTGHGRRRGSATDGFGATRLGRGVASFLESLEDFGVGQLSGHLNIRLDLQRLPELLDTQFLLLRRNQDHTHMNVRPGFDGMLVEAGATTQIQCLLQQLPGFLELKAVVGVQRFLVQRRHFLQHR